MSAYALYRKLWLNIFRPSILLLVLIKVKATSKTKNKKYAEIRCPWAIPLTSLKWQAVFPSFETHDSWFSSNVLIHFIKSSSKPYHFRTDIKKK